jgi:hypothetical protein
MRRPYWTCVHEAPNGVETWERTASPNSHDPARATDTLAWVCEQCGLECLLVGLGADAIARPLRCVGCGARVRELAVVRQRDQG